ncbi:hypothetical protein DMC30DRAFT_420306 [Rhodotorula diobovata]|uniref:Uncharacterized protein n=1 Tax=Rhodotorula diobovata TaxID=5288 RepID=A0A5C5FJD1_9BASI|nr:hypothetical protein DMC30DRAFT_420306 [Rhodotorula diobovata]
MSTGAAASSSGIPPAASTGAMQRPGAADEVISPIHVSAASAAPTASGDSWASSSAGLPPAHTAPQPHFDFQAYTTSLQAYQTGDGRESGNRDNGLPTNAQFTSQPSPAVSDERREALSADLNPAQPPAAAPGTGRALEPAVVASRSTGAAGAGVKRAARGTAHRTVNSKKKMENLSLELDDTKHPDGWSRSLTATNKAYAVSTLQWGGMNIFLTGHPRRLSRAGRASIPHFEQHVSSVFSRRDKTIDLTTLKLHASLFPHPRALSTASYREVTDTITTLYGAMLGQEQNDTWGLSRKAQEAAKTEAADAKREAAQAQRELAERKEQQEKERQAHAEQLAAHIQETRRLLAVAGLSEAEIDVQLRDSTVAGSQV